MNPSNLSHHRCINCSLVPAEWWQDSKIGACQRDLQYKMWFFCSLPAQGTCLLSCLFLLKEKRKLYVRGMYQTYRMECLISVLENQVKVQVVIQQDQNAKGRKGGCLTLLRVSILLATFEIAWSFTFHSSFWSPFYTGVSWLLLRCHCWTDRGGMTRAGELQVQTDFGTWDCGKLYTDWCAISNQNTLLVPVIKSVSSKLQV